MAYLIYCTSDGPRVQHFEREDLQEMLEDCGLEEYSPFRTPPTDSDPNYWGEQYLVVDGELAVPLTESVIVKLVMPKKL